MALLVTSPKDRATHKAGRKCYASWSGWDSLQSRSFLARLLELFNYRQSVSWENLPASSQWTAAPCCPGCKGKVLSSCFLLNHFICFKDTEQSWSYSMRTRLSPQVLNSKGRELWKSYTTRVPKEFFPRKPWVVVGSWNWPSKAEGCRELMFDEQSMWSCCISLLRIPLKAYFLQKENEEHSYYDQECWGHWLERSLEPGWVSRSIRQLHVSCHYEPVCGVPSPWEGTRPVLVGLLPTKHDKWRLLPWLGSIIH